MIIHRLIHKEILNIMCKFCQNFQNGCKDYGEITKGITSLVVISSAFLLIFLVLLL
jgi:hypothetical protein